MLECEVKFFPVLIYNRCKAIHLADGHILIVVEIIALLYGVC